MVVAGATPVGTAATFDLIGAASRNRDLLRASHYMLGAGLITATGAAVPGAGTTSVSVKTREQETLACFTESET